MESLNRLYSIKDTKAGRFGPLFEAINEAVAFRQFSQIMEKIPPRFKQEYELYFMGTIDMVSGELQQETAPELVHTIIEE
ncbi:MAG: nonstructural protein [Arizlama microvirus]|nr:MAG: nonstructural protein [Arizlama microvirus]